jgi:hypothetical protein
MKQTVGNEESAVRGCIRGTAPARDSGAAALECDRLSREQVYLLQVLQDGDEITDLRVDWWICTDH